MKISNDIIYVGVNDHKIDLFEGQYVVPNGMAYNSYVIMDKKIAVFDTVDAKFTHEWLDNLEKAFNGRKPDYLIIQHMEPDHSANIVNFLKVYPKTTVVATQKAFTMMENFFEGFMAENKIVAENGGTLSLAANKEHDFHNMYVRGGTVNFHSAGYVDLVLSTNYIGASYPDIACLHITNTVVDMRANPEDNSPMQRTVIGGDGTATQQRGMLVIGEGACVTGQVYIGGSGAKGMGTLLIQGGSLLFPFTQNGVSSIAVGNGQQGYLRID